MIIKCRKKFLHHLSYSHFFYFVIVGLYLIAVHIQITVEFSTGKNAPCNERYRISKRYLFPSSFFSYWNNKPTMARQKSYCDVFFGNLSQLCESQSANLSIPPNLESGVS